MSLLSLKEMAAALRLSPRRLNQFVEQGIIPRADHGRYDASKILPALFYHYQDLARKRGGEDQSQGADDSISASNRRLRAALAEREEWELAKRKGQYISRDDYKRELGALFLALQERLFSIPAHAAPHLEAKSRAAIEARLEEEIHAVCAVLSQLPLVNDEQTSPNGRQPARKGRPRRSAPPAGPAATAQS